MATRFGFVALAAIFHIVYIYSIFDIYFVSPIVHGMQAYAPRRPTDADPPAQRLVLFVGDGLRADKAFQSFEDPSPELLPPRSGEPKDPKTPRPLMPFIRSRVEKHGTFGVSHTRVPTESRPGHVALIAGLYEDVSAVTTGWKHNPVNFDSVFNRSRHTWSWGSPDILPMFKDGAVDGRVDADQYGADFEDFTSEATQLDTWVFDRVNELFKSAATNKTLNSILREDRNVFFLHLLGLDTTGHAFRPYSREYLHNIKVVDRGVEQITKMIEDFYNDGKTAFVFTADHGMSDWGSHGDGHPDNTRTPLVAWGSGVRKPILSKKGTLAPGHEDRFSHDWGFDHVARHDVEQADVAALMAYLAGLAFPTNSVGNLPLAYLAAGPDEQAEAALANAQGILEMYRVKEAQKSAVEINYQPFPAFAEKSIEARVGEIRATLDSKKYELAIAQSKSLLNLAIGGLRYLQTYDWLFLRALVSAGYLGWIAYAATTVVDTHVLRVGGRHIPAARTPATLGAFGAIMVALFSVLVVRKSPITYYAYAIFPVVFWEEIWAKRAAVVEGVKTLVRSETGGAWKLVATTLGCVALMEALVASYFYRVVYTVVYLIAIAWPFAYGLNFIMRNKVLVAQWAVGCVLMSSCTLLPAMKEENVYLIVLGGVLMLTTGILYLVFEKSLTASTSKTLSERDHFLIRILLATQVALIAITIPVTYSSALSIQAKQGLPAINQIVGWIALTGSLVMPAAYSLLPENNPHYVHRLMVIFLTFSPTFVILTISYEGIFYFGMSMTLVAWVRLEHNIYVDRVRSEAKAGKVQQRQPGSAYRPLTPSDLRTAVFFFYFVQSGFFSTGNVASVSSFSLDSVYRLIPVFSPFSQGALLMLKLMIPFALISALLGILNPRLGVAPSALFAAVMALGDVMTMNFFYMVRDEGSWLDIGTSISHFVIVSLLCVFIALLEFVSEVFVRGVEVGGRVDEAEVAAVSLGKKGLAKGLVASELTEGSGTESEANGKKGGRKRKGKKKN